MRKPVMAGNWKMYKNAGETSAFLSKLAPMAASAAHAEVVICAPFVNLTAAVDAARSSNIEIGAQDVFWLKEGAYTGEISASSFTRVTACQVAHPPFVGFIARLLPNRFPDSDARKLPGSTDNLLGWVLPPLMICAFRAR